MARIEVTPEFLRKKANAGALLSLRDFLITHDIYVDDLDEETVAFAMINATVRETLSPENTLRNNAYYYMRRTIHDFTVEDLTDTPLFYVNRGILLVALLEHVLFPGLPKQAYERMYNCTYRDAIELYNELRGNVEFTLPGPVAAQRVMSFFHCDTFVEDTGCLERVRAYLARICLPGGGFIQREMQDIRDESIRLIERFNERPFENEWIHMYPDPMDF